MKLKRRTLVLASSAVGLGAFLPAFSAQRAQAVTMSAAPSQDAVWVDTAHNRNIPLRVYTPSTPAHGRSCSTAMAWVVAAKAVHYGAAPGRKRVFSAFTCSMKAVMRSNAAQAATGNEHAQRLADVRFVIDELIRRQKIPGALYRQANVQAIGLAGHSFGARTTLGLAALPWASAANIMHEPRLRAFIAFSPNEMGSTVHRSLRGPLLLITGTQDSDVLGNGTTPQGRQQVFADALPGDKYLCVLEGADHFTLAGNTDLPRRMARQRPESAIANNVQHQRAIANIDNHLLAGHAETRSTGTAIA
jgi:pimeloyl-ACP methyl ester carboxylesterase